MPSNSSFIPRLVLIELRKRLSWIDGSAAEDLKQFSIVVSFIDFESISRYPSMVELSLEASSAKCN